MRNFPFLLALGWLALPWIAAAQGRSPAPRNSPAEAVSPRRSAPLGPDGKRANGDDGKRGPRGPLDWEHTVALSPDGRWFVTRNLDGGVRVWETAGGKSEVALPEGTIDAVFSPDGSLLACEQEGRQGDTSKRGWRVHTTADGKPAGGALAPPAGQGDGPETVWFSPDGRLLAGFTGVGEQLAVVLWDALTGGHLASARVKELYGGETVAFSPDGKTLAAAGSGSAVLLFGVPDLKPLQTLPAEGHVIVAAAFSPDGKTLAVAGEEMRTVKGGRDGYPAARLYETATGRPVADLKVAPVRGARVRQVLFADGGRAVLTASDQSAEAWAVADGRRLVNLVDGSYPLAVAPDGKTVAGSSYPDLVFWDAATWRLLLKIPNAKAGYGTGTGHLSYVPLAFAPDGRGIVTLRGDGVASWELPVGNPRAEQHATQSRVVY